MMIIPYMIGHDHEYIQFHIARRVLGEFVTNIRRQFRRWEKGAFRRREFRQRTAGGSRVQRVTKYPPAAA